MKLSEYIRGLRKGKEAHRLEKESMKDSFLADAMDGYHQIEGDHTQRINKLRMQVSAHTAKKKNSYAITWSIAACLVIGIGISSYFIFLKKSMTEDVFITQEVTSSTVMEPKPNSPSPADMQSAETNKMKKDSAHEITVKETAKKHIIAKGQSETSEQMIALEKSVTADTDTSPTNLPPTNTSPVKASQTRIAQTEALADAPHHKMIKGKVTDENGEPIVGASILYAGTNIGTITNLNGEFALENKEGQKQIKAQYIGFDPVEIPVDTSQVMLIAMNEDKRSLDEVVAVGYGTLKKSTLTGSIAKTSKSSPQPTVGQRKYKKYLKDHLIRPNDDPCKDVKGEVLVSFFVDKEGNPQQITVKKGLCETADNEAIRLIKEGPKWIPGDQDLPVAITVQF